MFCKRKRVSFFHLRKCKLSPLERERILKIKAQMEVEIHALEGQIYREKLAQIARGNRPQMLTDGLR